MSNQAEKPSEEFTEELSEDMEVVGPGLMLSEARKKLSLSTEDVADKLKFKLSLVQNIEQDIFDPKLPATFNRGYLRSYAKLVNVDIDEILSAYDMLGVAELQRSEMQSFSNLTEKQAEHSRLMWFSYFIVAVLIGLMVLWWLQEPKQLLDEKTTQKPPAVLNLNSAQDEKKATEAVKVKSLPSESLSKTLADGQLADSLVENSRTESIQTNKTPTEEQHITDLNVIEPINNTVESAAAETRQAPTATLSTAVFTFSGDCWVNIYDATGERIAWGVKKSGYVMTISGKAPLKVTLGKPELAAIIFNGEAVDMTPFKVDNIAKFTLPLQPQP